MPVSKSMSRLQVQVMPSAVVLGPVCD